jgi:hypothetical protein
MSDQLTNLSHNLYLRARIVKESDLFQPCAKILSESSSFAIIRASFKAFSDCIELSTGIRFFLNPLNQHKN